MIDVIIPTIPGREASLERFLESLKKSTPDDPYREIVVPDSKTCGAGWKQGLELSSADYVLLACDDQRIVSDTWAPVGMEAADKGWIVCPRVYDFAGNIASNGGDMNAYAHLSKRPKLDWAEVDYTTIPFLSREAIDRIGMLEIHYASDVWVSYRGRQLGYRTCIRHGFDVVHYEEQIGRGAGMSQGERDQMDCETMNRALAELEGAPA